MERPICILSSKLLLLTVQAHNCSSCSGPVTRTSLSCVARPCPSTSPFALSSPLSNGSRMARASDSLRLPTFPFGSSVLPRSKSRQQWLQWTANTARPFLLESLPLAPVCSFPAMASDWLNLARAPVHRPAVVPRKVTYPRTQNAVFVRSHPTDSPPSGPGCPFLHALEDVAGHLGPMIASFLRRNHPSCHFSRTSVVPYRSQTLYKVALPRGKRNRDPTVPKRGVKARAGGVETWPSLHHTGLP